MLLAQTTTRSYIRAENKLQSISYLFILHVMKRFTLKKNHNNSLPKHFTQTLHQHTSYSSTTRLVSRQLHHNERLVKCEGHIWRWTDTLRHLEHWFSVSYSMINAQWAAKVRSGWHKFPQVTSKTPSDSVFSDTCCLMLEENAHSWVIQWSVTRVA